MGTVKAYSPSTVGQRPRMKVSPPCPTRNYTFRSREFEQMETEFFCSPEES